MKSKSKKPVTKKILVKDPFNAVKFNGMSEDEIKKHLKNFSEKDESVKIEDYKKYIEFLEINNKRLSEKLTNKESALKTGKNLRNLYCDLLDYTVKAAINAKSYPDKVFLNELLLILNNSFNQITNKVNIFEGKF